MKKVAVIIFISIISMFAETLFEVKDASNNTVLEVSTDGLRILNQGDTVMVISANEIKANLQNSKGLSRSFSVTTASSKGTSAFEVTGGSTTIGTPSTLIGSQSTIMRQGLSGDDYSDFSPDNIFIGLKSGEISSGINNVFVGNYTGAYNTTGYYNVFSGYMSGYLNEEGRENIFIGNYAGYSNVNDIQNVYIGSWSGYNSTGGYNTFVGATSGYENTTGVRNSFFGSAAGNFNSIGCDNSMFGNFAGFYNTAGGQNTIMGSYAGNGVYALSSYDQNCLFGSHTGYSLTTGSSNTMVGSYAGELNAIGTGNVFIGNRSGANEMGSNKLYIDNSDTSTPLIYGDFGTNVLQINGVMNIPSLFTTTSPDSRKALYVDENGKLCVAAKDVGNLPDSGNVEQLKEDNKKMKADIEYLMSEIEKLEKIINNLDK